MRSALIFLSCLFLIACSYEPPTCNIKYPFNGDRFEQGYICYILADASATDAEIETVDLYIDGEKTASKTTEPYGFNWNTKQDTVGKHTIRINVTDNNGHSSFDQITVKIIASTKLPVVISNDVNDIKDRSARLHGAVIDEGGSRITANGFYWTSIHKTPDSKDNVIKSAGQAENFEYFLEKLIPNQKYFYVAYATNSKGPGVGEVKSFTTAEDPWYESRRRSFTDSRDGHVYTTISIGSQTWMTENLAYLPVLNQPSDSSRSEPRYYVFNSNGNNVEQAINSTIFKTYGVLYNWPAADKACPAGWHLPSDEEWTQLQNYLIDNGYGYGGRGNKIAKAVASTELWYEIVKTGAVGYKPEENNQSGLTLIPGGAFVDTVFTLLDSYGYWWTSSSDTIFSNSAIFRKLEIYDVELNGWGYDKAIGISVRCVKD